MACASLYEASAVPKAPFTSFWRATLTGEAEHNALGPGHLTRQWRALPAAHLGRPKHNSVIGRLHVQARDVVRGS
jgi:hypothetical protein